MILFSIIVIISVVYVVIIINISDVLQLLVSPTTCAMQFFKTVIEQGKYQYQCHKFHLIWLHQMVHCVITAEAPVARGQDVDSNGPWPIW